MLRNDAEQNSMVMIIPHQLMQCPGISTNQLPGRGSTAGIHIHDVVDSKRNFQCGEDAGFILATSYKEKP